MRQLRIPEGETPKLSDFVPYRPEQKVITKSYGAYVEACAQAIKIAFKLREEAKERGEYDPKTFITEVWQKSPAYLKTEELWEQCVKEVKEIRQRNQVKTVEGIRPAVAQVLTPAA